MIFLDVDGVLADIDTAASELFGWDQKTIKEAIKEEQIKDHSAFWKLLQEKTDPTEFFATLPRYPWFDKLIRDCLEHGPVFIATSVSPHLPEMWTGKAKWLEAYVGRNFGKRIDVALIREKHRLARSRDDILIDDFEWQTSRFHSAGGSSLLFPTEVGEEYVNDGHFANDIHLLVTGQKEKIHGKTEEGDDI